VTRPPGPLTFCTALRGEARAVRHGTGLPVQVIGMRAHALSAARLGDAALILLVGYGGGLLPGQRPGDVVVATELRDGDGHLVRRLRGNLVASARHALAAAGIEAAGGPIASSERFVHGRARSALSAAGAIAVDMEAVPLARALPADGGDLLVVRVLVDTPRRGLLRAALFDGLRALREAATALAALAEPASAPKTSGTLSGYETDRVG
jgi:nucleoside phosphorylase